MNLGCKSRLLPIIFGPARASTWRLLGAVFLVTFAFIPASSAEDRSVTFHIQLIRGTNEKQPRDTEWKAIGPKLTKALAPVFSWKYYWEVKRYETAVIRGKSTRIKVMPERDLEIELIKGGRAELRLYRKGELRRKMTASIDSKLSILGGAAAEDEGWFIVVRRDKPSTE